MLSLEDTDFPCGLGLREERRGMKIAVLEEILQDNDAVADQNRAAFSEHGIYALNMMSSPGAGKTSLIERMVEGLGNDVRLGVVEGDVETTRDAERLDRLGVPVVQIMTQGACHLDARMVSCALKELDLGELDALVIENVGNLICPAGFRLGEDEKVVVLSVPEGEDKPLKYPFMFRESSALVVNKVDLIPYSPFDLDKAREYALQVNPRLEVFETSCVTGQGMDDWRAWFGRGVKEAKQRRGGA